MFHLFKVSFIIFITSIAISECKTSTSSKRGKRVIFTKIEQEVNKDLMSMQIQIKNISNGIPTVDLDSELFQDIPKDLYIENIISERVTVMDYNALIKTGKINLCDLYKNPNREPFLKMVLINLQKYGHMVYSCPVEKAKYFLKDFTMDSETSPQFTPRGDYRIDTTVTKKMKDVYILVFRTLWYGTVTD